MHIFSLVKLLLSRQFQPIGVQMRVMFSSACVCVRVWMKSKQKKKIILL